jgi:hypothetical protein
METFEVSKLQPVAISLAVRPKTGEIIDVGVASMRAKGRLADLAWLKGIERVEITQENMGYNQAS